MKIYLLTFLILFVTIIVILKLITSPTPVTTTQNPPGFKNYNTEISTHRNRDKAYYEQSTNSIIDDRKLIAFAKAFVAVQSYMNKAGSKASYKETSKIVQSYGLNVEDYTKIASKMNESSDFQNRVQKMINDSN
ncbi:hypothetical protein SCALIN_C11_0011 [Candidatus Scalindua japonica]|uniref:DUF4168 domain-containing protein n=1 Tax=Candidatus Scalindua japonica TaxID=1284222 RepID=A0A286TX06_9BACT|nr:DUF4168 domain-containing protein [Candidatus Scalindua japonica]GAX60400.1 hypothetical protein SCALIN_C11_0011 [Candidatus Scalindua japonica]